MTLPVTSRKAGPYTCNGVQVAFDFDFKVFTTDDILVVHTNSLLVENDLMLTADYSVVLNADQETNPGGVITTVLAYPSTDLITVIGDLAYSQPTHLTNLGGFFPAVIEAALDRLGILVQQLLEVTDRSVKVNVSSTTDPDALVGELIGASADAVAAAAVAVPAAATATAAAATAQAAADSIGFRDVIFLTVANSPYTVVQATSGKLLSVDTSGGNVIVNLPTIAALALPYTVGVKKATSDANTVTINRGGTDQFDDGSTSQTISSLSGMTLIPDTDTAPDKWSIAQFGAVTGQQKKQQFIGGVDFTAGVTTTLTINEAPIASSKDVLTWNFNGASGGYIQEDAWSYNPVTGVTTFTSAIPVGTTKIEAVWTTPLSIGTPADATVSATKLADDAVIARVLADSAMGFSLTNGKIVASVGANALTLAIKTFAGTDPTAADPVHVRFRSVTPATGDYTVLSITAATSFVVSSGSTLGGTNSTAFKGWIVGFNDAGTFRLGVINCLAGTAPSFSVYPLSQFGIASSTAEGGAGAADSSQVFYTGVAVAAKAYSVLGYFTYEAGLAAVGAYASAPTRMELFKPGVPLPGQVVQVQRSQTGAVATGTTAIPNDDTIPQITEGDQYMSQAITPTSAANLLRAQIELNGSAGAGNYLAAALFQDAVANALAAIKHNVAANNVANKISFSHTLLAALTTATTLRVRAGASSGTTTFNGETGARIFGGVLASSLQVEEVAT